MVHKTQNNILPALTLHNINLDKHILIYIKKNMFNVLLYIYYKNINTLISH